MDHLDAWLTREDTEREEADADAAMHAQDLWIDANVDGSRSDDPDAEAAHERSWLRWVR